MRIRFIALDTDLVTGLQTGAPDANGQPPERAIASEDGYPCRHCLGDIKRGESYLTLAHRPFPSPQPYAEVGPIFLHAEPCSRGGDAATLPVFLDSPQYIVRGYNHLHRIVYGTGRIVATAHIPVSADEVLRDPRIAYLHVRSASNNCYQCRIERT